VRLAVLAVLLAAVARAAPSTMERIGEYLEARKQTRVELAGDPMLLAAAAADRPTHPFPSGESAEAVQAWRTQAIARLHAEADLDLSQGAHVATVPVTIERVETVGDIRPTLVTFTSWDDTPIPAYVNEPLVGKPRPAVLVVPGHGYGIEATSGIVADYQHSASFALARRGFVTLTPELRGFGRLTPGPAPVHRLVAAAALARGSSYKAVTVRDLHRALTVLEHWPGVNASRLGVAGTSLGGELAVLLSALDQRVRVTVSNSYGGLIGAAVEVDAGGDNSAQTPHLCHTIPGVSHIVLEEDWARLIAPRPLLLVCLARATDPRPRTVSRSWWHLLMRCPAPRRSSSCALKRASTSSLSSPPPSSSCAGSSATQRAGPRHLEAEGSAGSTSIGGR
jgi:dienelactone hydrolase